MSIRSMKQSLVAGTLLFAILQLPLSCTSEDNALPDVDPIPTEVLQAGFSIEVEDIASRAPSETDYNSGNKLENRIDIEKEDYKFLFFSNDANPTFLSEFKVQEVTITPVSGTNRKRYDVLGTINKPIGNEFRLVVLANWRSYPNLSQETTLSEVCESQYTYQDFLNEDKQCDLTRHYIPMYGVRSYQNVTFLKNLRTDLGTIHLLRAMAKIEVSCSVKGYTLKNVWIDRCNKAGYCAPTGIYTESNYKHNDYKQDYVPIHLVRNKNDYLLGTDNNPAPVYLTKQTEATTENGTFVTYVPEYKNVKEGNGPETAEKADDAAQIKVTLSKEGQEEEEKEYTIDFKYYNEDAAKKSGKNVGDFFNIQRNYYYIFTITEVNEETNEVKVDVKATLKWDKVYELNPTYGENDDPNHYEYKQNNN